jgi:hypothetical protein
VAPERTVAPPLPVPPQPEASSAIASVAAIENASTQLRRLGEHLVEVT